MSAVNRISLTFGCLFTIIASTTAQQPTVPQRMNNKLSGVVACEPLKSMLPTLSQKTVSKASDRYVYDIKDGEADIFGQLRYQKNVNGTGLIHLTSHEPKSFSWIRDYGFISGTTPILTAGTYVGDDYYAFETTYYSNTLMPKAISVVDVNTGEYKSRREIENDPQQVPLVLDEMTYDPKTDKLFGMHYDTENNYTDLYEINRTTLEMTKVARVEKVLFALSADNGYLYGIYQYGSNSKLCKIAISSIEASAQTCTIEDVSSSGTTGVAVGNYSQSMEFDKTTHRLWWLAQTDSGESYFVELDPQSGKTLSKTLLTNELQLLAMAIPYQYVADTAPSYPCGLSVSPDAAGSLSATLQWTMPSKNYQNESLDNLSGVKIYRNGELLKTVSEAQLGKQMSWTDTPTTDGYYIYKVQPYNTSGDGVYKEYSAFVGEDLPGEPQNVSLTAVGPNATISWDAPEAGMNGGYFDRATLKYNVVRQPDNVTVVAGTTSTMVSDIVSQQKGYSYEITAINAKGQGATTTSNTLSFGPVNEIPFTSSLTTQEDFDRWVTDDANGDGNTWSFYTPTQTTTYDRSEVQADDWLYSPALTFDKNKTYQLRYTYSTANWVSPIDYTPVMESMNVWLCSEPLSSKQRQFIYDPDEFHTASNIYLYGKDLFQPKTSGSARIGFHAYSEANRGQIYIKDVSVREYSTKDLSVTGMTGSILVNSQVSQTFTVTVCNEGSAEVKDYRVELLNAETKELLGEARGIAVAKDVSVDVPVTWVPGAEGVIKVTAKVELDGDTYPADNTLTNPLEVKINPAEADRWITLNTDNSYGWAFPFWMLDPYAKNEFVFLEKEIQKKNIDITGIRLLYDGQQEAAYTFPATIKLKGTTRNDVLNASGTKAEFESGNFTEVFNGNITVSGKEMGTELVLTFSNPYHYDGGNLTMSFETTAGWNQASMSGHPLWHFYDYEEEGGNPRTVYFRGTSSSITADDVYGSRQMPFLSISYTGGDEDGIIPVYGNNLGVEVKGNMVYLSNVCPQVKLFGMSGIEVYGDKNAQSVDISKLPKGVYALMLKTANGERVIKITKK